MFSLPCNTTCITLPIHHIWIIQMPTVLRLNGYRFFFFSLEGNEPPHIHVENGDRVAKYWLNPISLASSYGFRTHELAKIRLMVSEHCRMFLEKWHEFFSSKI
jgi:hypothetical protein